MTEADWQRVTLYAAPQAIEARLKTAERALRAAQRTVDRWEELRVLRAGQVEAGTWPESAKRAAAAEEEERRASWAVAMGDRGLIHADSRLAVDPDGKIKLVSEFAAVEKWWCDGEDCAGPGGPDLSVPHVHCEMHTHLVDLLAGKAIDQEVASGD
jgi:hypothetical protein